MPDTPDQAAAITDTAAAGPASAAVDGRSATQHKLSDLIEWEKFRGAQAAAGNGNRGLRFTQLVPGGCG